LVQIDDVKAYFSQFGAVKAATLGKSGTCAVVVFEDSSVTETIISKRHHYNGEEIRVEYKKYVLQNDFLILGSPGVDPCVPSIV
jgi:hypothetical protein